MSTAWTTIWILDWRQEFIHWTLDIGIRTLDYFTLHFIYNLHIVILFREHFLTWTLFEFPEFFVCLLYILKRELILSMNSISIQWVCSRITGMTVLHFQVTFSMENNAYFIFPFLLPVKLNTTNRTIFRIVENVEMRNRRKSLSCIKVNS